MAQLQKSVKIAPGAVVCVESEIKGDVTIGPRTVVHPKARIFAEAGPIVIGEGNLIEEQAFIRNSFPENIAPDAEDVEPKAMIISTNNVFEVGCYSQAMKIGDNNVIESKATDLAVGLPDEDSSKLSPPQEDHKNQQSSNDKLVPPFSHSPVFLLPYTVYVPLFSMLFIVWCNISLIVMMDNSTGMFSRTSLSPF